MGRCNAVMARFSAAPPALRVYMPPSLPWPDIDTVLFDMDGTLLDL